MARTRLTGTRTTSVGVSRQGIVSFDAYFDKGIKKIVKEWGEQTKENVNQAIMDGIRNAAILAKQDTADLMSFSNKRGKTAQAVVKGLPPLLGDRKDLGPNQKARNEFPGQQLVMKHNRRKDVNAMQRIWDSLGYSIFDERARHVRAVLGSADWADTGHIFSGVRAVTAPDQDSRVTTGRKPDGGFNLAEAFEQGVPSYKYDFKSSHQDFMGVTPARTPMFDATVGVVTLVKEAYHPGFKKVGAVATYRDNFIKYLAQQVLGKLGSKAITNLNSTGGFGY
ncbi:MAG: hypothetical protein CMC15_14080 [Flavobacteriaceae bacterium]|nr:hypothetical protein [Flavobacteriaceae bacterium]